jgi:uncharacterized membrane protein
MFLPAAAALLSGPNPLPSGFLWVFVGALVVIGILSFLVPLAARGDKTANNAAWRGGIFYFNREDPALFVPKRFGIGYTLNFANRWSWLIVGILLVLILTPFVFSAITVATIRHQLTSH